MKKVFFFDIDGTLLDYASDIKSIPAGVKHEMNRLKQNGYYLFIASGRPLAFIPDEILKMEFDGYVLCNGAHIIFRNQTIYEHPCDYKKLKRFINLLEFNHIQYDLETSDYCYFDPSYLELLEYFRQFRLNENLFVLNFDKDLILKRTMKLEMNIPKEKKARLLPYINADFSYDNNGTSDTFEIYDKHISKASGINKVLQYLDIPAENSYAIGDGVNDIEMIRFVGHGIAMGNAVNELKSVADLIIDPVQDGGLEKYLKTVE